MTDRSLKYDIDEDALARHHALVSLHALSGTFGKIDLGLLPEFRSSSTEAALSAVAGAPEDDIPLSARLAVLYQLAKAQLPDYERAEQQYRLLAESVAGPRNLDAVQLLTDVKQAAGGLLPFQQTPSGRALPAEERAFIGQDVCTTRRVQVGGLKGTWIFSEFETDAPFDNVAGWVDPRTWPERGPMLFKRMDIVGAGGPVDISPPFDGHWHGVFHEEVQLVKRLNTLLHCDYWRDGDHAAGMTYNLDLSLDDEINVDRGFLLVNNVGPVRRVKALKIVGFTTEEWDRVARLVCPFWTDWVRAAVRGGTSGVPKPGTDAAAGGPGPGPAPSSSWVDNLEAWIEFFGDSARSYLGLFDDVTSRMTSQGYSTSDCLADGRRYWSQLAKDWAGAWSYGVRALDDVAREGFEAGFTPPGRPTQVSPETPSAVRAMATPSTESEGTLIPVPGLGPDDRPVSSELVSIEAGGATIPAGKVRLRVEPLDDGTYGVRVQTSDMSVAPGLYVGTLTMPERQAQTLIQLYLSRATGT